MSKQWNVVRDFYNKKRPFKPAPWIVRQWKSLGFYLISFEEAEKIKQKYIYEGMQLYHDRYEVQD